MLSGFFSFPNGCLSILKSMLLLVKSQGASYYKTTFVFNLFFSLV